jgi:hypothetical protein
MSTPTRDMGSNLSSTLLMTPGVLIADSPPISVDLLGFRAAMAMIWVGIGGIAFTTTNKVEFVLEHSTDNLAWAAVAQTDVVGVTVATGGVVRSLVAAKPAIDASPTEVSYIGGRRYIRLIAKFSGTHATGTLMAAFAIRALPDLVKQRSSDFFAGSITFNGVPVTFGGQPVTFGA